MKLYLRKKALMTALSAVITMSSLSFAADMPTAFQGDAESQANCQKMGEQINLTRQQRIEELIPKPANETFSTGTCLDRLMSTRVNIFTISLDGVIDRILNAAQNKACSIVMGAWNQAINTANQTLGTRVNVPYVGTVLNTSVGSGIGGPININNGNGIPELSGNTGVQSNNTATTSSRPSLATPTYQPVARTNNTLIGNVPLGNNQPNVLSNIFK